MVEPYTIYNPECMYCVSGNVAFYHEPLDEFGTYGWMHRTGAEGFNLEPCTE